MSKACPKIGLLPFSMKGLRNGGAYRARQVLELLESADVDLELFEGHGKMGVLSQAAYSAQRILRYKYLPSRFPRGWALFAQDYALAREIGKGPKTLDAIVWEATSEPRSIDLYRQVCGRIIAVPQNIESLGARRTNNLVANLKGLSNELRFLSRADSVFTISQEESWLLNLCGIESHCLPYFPPQDVCLRLADIRHQRDNCPEKQGFLALGTMANPPTSAGMISLCQFLANTAEDRIPQIDFVGAGTESLKEWASSPNLRFHGIVDNEPLDKMRVRARGLIVNQRATTGIVTRIVESLLAGLPVLANYDGARGFTDTAGVHVYKNEHELAELLQSELPTPPMPQRPVEEEAAFISVFS